MFFTNKVFNNDIFEFLNDDFFFNSPVQDMNPVTYYQKGRDYIIEVKTLGINKSDINVALNNDILTISGESKNEYNDKSFNTNVKVKLGKSLIDNAESIDYTSKNGVTYVFIHTKKSQSDAIKINKI